MSALGSHRLVVDIPKGFLGVHTCIIHQTCDVRTHDSILSFEFWKLNGPFIGIEAHSLHTWWHDDSTVAVMAGIVGTSSWVPSIGHRTLVLSSISALSGFVLLGNGTVMIDAFLAGFLVLVACTEVVRFFLALGVPRVFLLTCIDWHLVSFMIIYFLAENMKREMFSIWDLHDVLVSCHFKGHFPITPALRDCDICPSVNMTTAPPWLHGVH